MPEAMFLMWQQQFNIEDDSLEYLKKMKEPTGFICPSGGDDHKYEIRNRYLYECMECKKQNSVSAATLFYGSSITLTQWFWAIYFHGSDKGCISALRLNKLIEVNWRTAKLILNKLRMARDIDIVYVN